MVWKHLFQPFMLNVEICPKRPQRGKYCFVWQGKISSENFLLFGLNIFISPQLCMRYTTIIPSCGGDSSIHASQCKQYEIDWHLCRLSEVHLQHKLKLFVPMSFPRKKHTHLTLNEVEWLIEASVSYTVIFLLFECNLYEVLLPFCVLMYEYRKCILL